jgi:hypothetical protein
MAISDKAYSANVIGTDPAADIALPAFPDRRLLAQATNPGQ